VSVGLPVVVSLPQFAPRREKEPVVDLTALTVVHRAQRTDTRRFADVVRALADGQTCGASRLAALQEYLSGMAHCLQNGRRTAREVLVPLLLELGADNGRLSARQNHDDALVELLTRTAALLPELPGERPDGRSPDGVHQTLDTFVAVVEAAIADDEQILLPLVSRHLTPESLHWVQAQCHRSLRPQLLPFIVPWLLSHATEEERETICSQALPSARAILKAFGSSFLDTRRTAFG
jgi:hypothetical protein